MIVRILAWQTTRFAAMVRWVLSRFLLPASGGALDRDRSHLGQGTTGFVAKGVFGLAYFSSLSTGSGKACGKLNCEDLGINMIHEIYMRGKAVREGPNYRV
ncbi:hypothetical protein Tco_0489591 [Tanacetum coccineum]